jgi:hypothetical protein
VSFAGAPYGGATYGGDGFAGEVAPTPGPPPPGEISPTDARMIWLRRLLDDRGTPQLEQAVASGQQVEFFVRAPPIVGQPTVLVNGVSTTEFTVDSYGDEVILSTAPPLGTSVLIRYIRTTWPDEELSDYLNSAASLWGQNQSSLVVYQAGIYAIDGLMAGSATAMDFGEGLRDFRFSQTFGELLQLRTYWQQQVDDKGAWGQLEIADWTFDSLQPGDLDDDPAQGIYGVPGGVFPEQRGSYGGLNW